MAPSTTAAPARATPTIPPVERPLEPGLGEGDVDEDGLVDEVAERVIGVVVYISWSLGKS